MKNTFVLKKAARSLVLASVIIFSAAGVAHAAGAGDQTGEFGDMSGHGGPIDKKAAPSAGQPSSGQGATSGERDYRKKPDGSTPRQGGPSYDKPYDRPAGQGGGTQGGGSGQSGGGGGY